MRSASPSKPRRRLSSRARASSGRPKGRLVNGGRGGEPSCGFVALIGAPNAGKSTLINRLVGTKVSIVSRKVQTTRSSVRGIAVEGKAQIVFVDTPGIFTPKRRLDRAMVASAWGGTGDADAAALLVDVHRASMPMSRPFSAACRTSPPRRFLSSTRSIRWTRQNFSNSPPGSMAGSPLRKHS